MKKFEKHFSYFERATSKRGPIKTGDGVTRNAIFCMRDLLRELPAEYMKSFETISPQRFISIIRSSYATKRDLKLNKSRVRHMNRLQKCYMRLVQTVSKNHKLKVEQVLAVVTQRSQLINRQERVTGDAISHIQDRLLRSRRKMTSKQMHDLIVEFVNNQILDPDLPKSQRILRITNLPPTGSKLMQDMQAIIRDCREGL